MTSRHPVPVLLAAVIVFLAGSFYGFKLLTPQEERDFNILFQELMGT